MVLRGVHRTSGLSTIPDNPNAVDVDWTEILTAGATGWNAQVLQQTAGPWLLAGLAYIILAGK